MKVLQPNACLGMLAEDNDICQTAVDKTLGHSMCFFLS